MYNREIKERFMEEHATITKKKFENLFGISGSYENNLGKDVAEMTKDEAVYMLSDICFFDFASLETALSRYKTYSEWCRDKGVFSESCLGMLEISSRDIDPAKAIARMFFREEGDLLRSLGKVIPIDSGYSEAIAAIFLWLGVDIRDSLKLKESDVDLERRIIANESGEILVEGFPDTIHEVLMGYSKLTTATRWNKEVIKDLSYDTFIKRFAPRNSVYLGKPLDYVAVRGKLAKDNQAYVELGYPPRLTPTNILKSGYLHRLWELEESGVDLYAKSSREIVEGIYKKSTYRRIIWQYSFYKKAFNL